MEDVKREHVGVSHVNAVTLESPPRTTVPTVELTTGTPVGPPYTSRPGGDANKSPFPLSVGAEEQLLSAFLPSPLINTHSQLPPPTR